MWSLVVCLGLVPVSFGTLIPRPMAIVTPRTNISTLVPSTNAGIDPRLVNLTGNSNLTSSFNLLKLDIELIKFPKSRRRRQTSCSCMTSCSTTTTQHFGAGMLDPRIMTGGTGTTGTAIQCSAGFVYCCPTNCGSRFVSNVNYALQAGQARYGDYPWMAVILTTDNSYVGGGALINQQHVLTVAHRIRQYPNAVGLKVRLGEWDASGGYEQFPSSDYTITRLWVHGNFNPSTLQNTIALMRIASAVPSGTSGVIPVCLPNAGQVFDGMRCWVSGWGRDAFNTGNYQGVLKTVDVPIIPASTCETRLESTRLGTAFTLDKNSFICAGGEAGKDSCTGDGGSGLVCETSPGRWTLAGLVAWGIGCGSTGIPAGYVNVASYLTWINQRVTGIVA